MKLYAKLIARRLEKVLPSLVHPDQTGFVKHRLASDNIHRLLYIIHYASYIPSPCAILSIENAFNRLEWLYLWYTVQRIGYGGKFNGVLQTLYTDPSAIVPTGS